MTENKRFVSIDDDEVYYITDTKDLKSLDDYIEEFSKAEYGYNDEEVLSVAKEEYWQMIYENSMTAAENVDMLNELHEENNLIYETIDQYLLFFEKLKEQKGVDIDSIDQRETALKDLKNALWCKKWDNLPKPEFKLANCRCVGFPYGVDKDD